MPQDRPENGDDQAPGRATDRRGYLKLATAGATVGSALALLAHRAGRSPAAGRDEDADDTDGTSSEPTGTAAAATVHGIPFDRTVDVVSDLGGDPTGTTPVDEVLNGALEDGSLVVFPAGEYRFGGPVAVEELDRVGFLGRGNVKLVPPRGFNGFLFDLQDVGRTLVGGVDVVVTAPVTTAGIRAVARDRFVVEDIEFVGRGLHPDGEVVNAFSLAVGAGGEGVLRNAVARQGSAIGHYKGGNGRVGVWVGRLNQGTVVVDDCRFEEFGNNGIYASRTPGNVRVRNSVFRNNNVSSVRVSGAGSAVENVVIEVDLDDYAGPRTRMVDSFNTRGIWIEQNREVAEKPAGVAVRDCDIVIGNTDSSQGAVVVSPNGKSLAVEDTRIRVEAADALAVQKVAPARAESYPVTMENVSMACPAPGQDVVLIRGGAESVIADCCLHSPDTGRNGIRFVASPGSRVTDSVLNVGGRAIVSDTDVLTRRIVRVGTCPAPLPGRIEVRGTGPPVRYRLTVTGQVEVVTDSGDAGGDVRKRAAPGEAVGETVFGTVAASETDAFRFSGTLVAFEVVDGSPAHVELDVDGTDDVGVGGMADTRADREPEGR